MSRRRPKASWAEFVRVTSAGTDCVEEFPRPPARLQAVTVRS